MRVLIVSPVSILPNTRGTTERIIRLCRGLRAGGNEVFVLHAGKSSLDGIMKGFFSVEDVLSTSSGIARFLDLNTAPFNPSLFHALMRYVRREEIDVVQFEFPFSFPVFVSFLRGLGDSCFHTVVDMHNVQSDLARSTGHFYVFPYILWLESMVLHGVDIVLTVSDDDRSYMIAKYDIPAEKTILVPNGVDIHSFDVLDRDQARRSLSLGTDELIVLFHGSITTRANREAVLNISRIIVPQVRAANDEIRFLIAGEGSEKLSRYVKGRREGMELLGFVRDIEALVTAADVCILPLSKGGGTSLRILEYMAAQKPVVTTEVGARGFPIRDGEHAIVRNDLHDFGEAIVSLFESSDHARQLGHRARDLASRYDWKNIGERLSSTYLDLFK